MMHTHTLSCSFAYECHALVEVGENTADDYKGADTETVERVANAKTNPVLPTIADD